MKMTRKNEQQRKCFVKIDGYEDDQDKLKIK